MCYEKKASFKFNAVWVAVTIALVWFFVPRIEEHLFLEKNKCNLIDEEPTDKQIFSVSAGFRQQIKRTYKCSFGEHYVYY